MTVTKNTTNDTLDGVEYDGLLQLSPDEIEEHQKIFLSKEVDGVIYFPFRYVKQACGSFYAMINKNKYNTRN